MAYYIHRKTPAHDFAPIGYEHRARADAVLALHEIAKRYRADAPYGQKREAAILTGGVLNATQWLDDMDEWGDAFIYMIIENEGFKK
jgi:hypothetical protein